MVKLVRAGSPARHVARQFGVGLSHVQYWVARALGLRLDRVDWCDHSPGPPPAASRCATPLEDSILEARRTLRESVLGEWGAQAIHAHLTASAGPLDATVPSVRTIGRVLVRRGLLDSRARTRRAPPPSGWYLPLLAACKAELDSFDIVEGLFLTGGVEVEVFNAMSVHGGLPGSWPQGRFTTPTVMTCLIAHWQKHGLPAYVQFDNATLFQGANAYADKLGRVVRLCLQLGVTPVFAPPRETGFQAAIESYNARWQAKLWQRFNHADLAAVQQRSAAYVEACELKAQTRIAAVKHLRRAYPKAFEFNAQAPLKNTVIFLRRSDEEGQVTVMGRRYEVGTDWQHRLVRAEVNFTGGEIKFFALRRTAHASQPLLHAQPYEPAAKQPGGLRALPDVASRGRRLGKSPPSPDYAGNYRPTIPDTRTRFVTPSDQLSLAHARYSWGTALRFKT